MNAIKTIFGRLSEFVANHKLPVCVFGGSFGILLAVTGYAYFWGPDGFWKHVWERNIQLHLFAGAGLYLLFSRLTLLYERLRDVEFGWFRWFLTPVACVMLISLTQEYGLSMMGETAGHWGGDFDFWTGHPVERSKSFADNATWFFGSMAAAWYAYYMPARLSSARLQYLHGKTT